MVNFKRLLDIKRIAPLVNKVLEIVKPNLQTFAKYAVVELVPPSPTEIGGIASGFRNLISGATSGKWKQTTVKEAWLNTLVATEVGCWFFMGECIGRGSLVGYNIFA